MWLRPARTEALLSGRAPFDVCKFNLGVLQIVMMEEQNSSFKLMKRYRMLHHRIVLLAITVLESTR
jgi:hypothetical protein